MRAPILKRALQVVARAPGKRGAPSTLGSELGAHPLENSAMLSQDYFALLPLPLPRPD